MRWKKINNGLIPEQELMGRCAGGQRHCLRCGNQDVVYAEQQRAFSAPRRVENNGNESGNRSPTIREQYPLDPGQTKTLYIGGGGGVWKAPTAGNLTATTATRLVNIRGLAMSPRDSHLLYAARMEAALPFDRRGATWTPLPLKTAPPVVG